jgi:RNA polymerase sigma factor (TIGR02999 family)
VDDDAASEEVDRILGGETVDMGRLLPLVYDKLREIAAMRMAAEKRDHTLQPTALVHEAYLKLLRREAPTWRDKAHFFAAASEAMRQILVDHARGKGRAKRGGGARRLPLDAAGLAAREDPDEILAVHEAICRLEERDGRMAQMVKLRFFSGLSDDEVAEVLRVSARTVRNDWRFARAFLQREISR